ncbi:hypothetical protein [Sphingomonas sp.]|uniref:hypothetical protein n=1 Tax=Sphingomonas sp. TaxID=28214 RepID=UPI001ED1DFC9|nr:hypothetical protein [Sphingomonas sp.]MBX3593951.1 hypothetical protein [Sphingomonas sp.]
MPVVLPAIALLLAVAPLQSGEATARAADQRECTLCARKLELDAARWNCLLRKREALQGEPGDAVIVQLDPRSCNEPVASARKAGASSRSGSADLIVTDGGGMSRALIMLSKRQLQCLADAKSAKQAGALVSFDFGRQCPP